MSDTVQEYKKYNIANAQMIYLPVNQGIGDINIDDYNLKKPYSAYVLNLYLEYDNFKNNKIDVYKTPLGVFSKITSN
jgi:hypothetical protein